MSDAVNHPNHYTCYEHEVIELSSQFDFCMGNVVKYILRADHKGRKLEDLKKALWYLDYENAMVEKLSLTDAQLELAKTYKSALLIAVLCDPHVEGRQALLLAIKDAEIEDLKQKLTEERSKQVVRPNPIIFDDGYIYSWLKHLSDRADFPDTYGSKYRVWCGV